MWDLKLPEMKEAVVVVALLKFPVEAYEYRDHSRFRCCSLIAIAVCNVSVRCHSGCVGGFQRGVLVRGANLNNWGGARTGCNN